MGPTQYGNIPCSDLLLIHWNPAKDSRRFFILVVEKGVLSIIWLTLLKSDTNFTVPSLFWMINDGTEYLELGLFLRTPIFSILSTSFFNVPWWTWGTWKGLLYTSLALSLRFKDNGSLFYYPRMLLNRISSLVRIHFNNNLYLSVNPSQSSSKYSSGSPFL